MRSIRIAALLMVFAVLFAACATFGPAKPWTQMTPKEKSLFFITTYNRQFDDTMKMAVLPNLTEGQKEIVRAKKAILMQAYHPIRIYESIAVSGGIPSPQDEAAILEFINQLATIGG